MITMAVNAEPEKGKVYFVDGPGGHGKTYLFNTVLGHVHQQDKIALAVASSGIASLLLHGGQTAHSRFKIPLNLDSDSTCNINRQSELANLIRQTKLIIWDEAPMTHCFALEALDRTLQDIRHNDNPFGGLVVVLGGDFRQTLPVVKRASRAAIVESSIKRSHLWENVTSFTLSQNMRLDEN